MRHHTLTAAEREVYESGEWVVPPSDVDRMLTLLSPLCSGTDSLFITTIEGPPKSKARPRFGKRNVYTPSTPDEDAMAWRLKAVMDERHEGNVVVAAIFFRPNFQRIDVDNLLKLILDAGTKAGLWRDDSQVTALLGVLEYDKARPRTVVGIGEHVTTLDRTRPTGTCPVCQKEFPLDFRGQRQKHCSPECRGKALRKPPIQMELPKPLGRPRVPVARCRDCGAEVSRREYIRCRDCWRAARTKGIS
jgi:Holliday junction resolvase RusA-like endonuclease